MLFAHSLISLSNPCSLAYVMLFIICFICVSLLILCLDLDIRSSGSRILRERGHLLSITLINIHGLHKLKTKNKKQKEFHSRVIFIYVCFPDYL